MELTPNLWHDSQATDLQDPLDLRVYTSRLLGADSNLVLHGGGNTSVKMEQANLLGEKETLLYIKGSGADLSSISKKDFTPIRLHPILKYRNLESLDDSAMMNLLRTHQSSADAPSPSVETLLHAFLPHRFVDHTHADALLALTNQPRGESIVEELYGNKIALVPYVMAGFDLAKTVISLFEENPNVEGMVLLRHGLLTFGESAKESYDRMINLVRQADEYCLSKISIQVPVAQKTSQTARADCIQNLRRCYLKRGFQAVFCTDFSDSALAFVNAKNALEYCSQGPLTPDHVTRTKTLPLFVKIGPSDLDGMNTLFDDYENDYRLYFERNCKRKNVELNMLDPLPKIVLIEGVGLVAVGENRKRPRLPSIFTNTR